MTSEQKPGGDKGASQTCAIAARFQAEGRPVLGHGDWAQLGSLKHRQEATELGECLEERIRAADFSHWECSADCVNLSSLQSLWPFSEQDGKFWKTLSMSNVIVIQFWFRKQLSDLLKGGCGLGEVGSRHEVGTPVWGSAITADKDDGGVGGSSKGGEKIVRFWKYSCEDKRQMMVFQKERESF